MAKTQIDQEFIQLVTENQGIIHKVCGMYCNTQQDRDDLFQEVVLQIWRSYGSFKGNSKITTWMYRIALNTAISGFRKKKRRPQEQSISLAEFQLADSPVDVEFEEKLKVMYTAINQLNKVEKAIVMLYLEEQSYEEIAEVVGITPTNVGVKLHRIKNKLSKMVKKRYDGVR